MFNMGKVRKNSKYYGKLSFSLLRTNTLAKWGSILVLILLISGCSARFAYNQVDMLIMWYVDDYVEFNSQQEAQFEEALVGWLDWHRDAEISRYINHLIDLKIDLNSGALGDEEVFLEHQARARAHIQRVRSKLAEDLYVLASRLSSEQVNHLFDNISEQRRKRREEYQQESAQVRMSEQQDELVERFEGWFGEPSPIQRQLLQSSYTQTEETYLNWLEYQQAYSAELQRILKERQQVDNDQNRQQFIDCFERPERFMSEMFKQKRAANDRVYANTVARLVNSLSPEQVEHASEELNRLIEQLISIRS